MSESETELYNQAIKVVKKNIATGETFAKSKL